MLTFITSKQVSAPAGHYSQAVIHNSTVYVSGLLPVRIGEAINPGMLFDEQVEVVFNNLKYILQEAGSSLDQVIKVTVYISDIGLWPAFNQLYANIFGEHKPARVVVPVPELHHGFTLEVEVIAAVGYGVMNDE